MPTPLHPFVVHLPIALSLLMPALAAAALLAWWRGWLPGRRAWVLVVALQALLLGGTWLGVESGEAEAERVERYVRHAVLEAHEEAAERLLSAVGATLLVAALALVPRRTPLAQAIALVALGAMTIVVVLTIGVGRAGGRLVYEEGAAAAYAEGAARGGG